MARHDDDTHDEGNRFLQGCLLAVLIGLVCAALAVFAVHAWPEPDGLADGDAPPAIERDAGPRGSVPRYLLARPRVA